jgi:hypothetical protein
LRRAAKPHDATLRRQLPEGGDCTADLEPESGSGPLAEPHRSQQIGVFVHPLAIDAQHHGEISRVDKVRGLALVD